MDVRRPDIPNGQLPIAWREAFCRRKPLPPAAVAGGAQVIALHLVPAGMISAVTRIQIAPFCHDVTQNVIVMAPKNGGPQWWEPIVDPVPRIYWRWMLVEDVRDTVGEGKPVPVGTIFNFGPGQSFSELNSGTLSFPLGPPSELTGFDGAIHFGRTRVLIEGPRVFGLLTEWNQAAIAPAGPFLIAQSFGALEGFDIPAKHFRPESLALLTQ